MYFPETSGEVGEVRGSQVHFIPWTHQENTHISINNSENNLKFGGTNSPQPNVEKWPYRRGQEGNRGAWETN